jgi:hypothetical protein
MSLDSIVEVNITNQSVSMSQAGFGVPLILGPSRIEGETKVDIYSDLSEMLNDGFKTDSPLYRSALKLKSQSPCVTTFKIGQGDLNAVYEADSSFYGLLLAEPTPELILKTAEWAENKRVLLGVDTKDFDNPLKEKSYRYTFSMYHPDPKEYAAAAFMGKLFPTQPGEATWAFKSLSSVKQYSLSTGQASQLDANNINRYTTINDVGVTLQGKCASGEYIDTIRGIDWLHARLQERIFMLLLKNKKIPYTDKGVDLVRCEIMGQLKEAISAGVLASQPEPTVSAPKVADIRDDDKAKRLLPNVSFSGTLAGAIHALKIEGVVSL